MVEELLKRKKVLMCAPNYYTSPFQVGSHHYARAFEKLGYKVAYISDPISLLHTVFSNNVDLKNRERIYKSGGIDTGNIWSYVPKAYITPQNQPLLSSEFIMNNWYKFASVKLLEVLKKRGFDTVDILWFDSPLFHFLLDEIKYQKSILRIADYSKGLDVSDVHYNKEIIIANRVDKVVYTASNLPKLYSAIENHSKMRYISNGIDLNKFNNCKKELPKEFNDIPSPRVIYIGAIEDWFDSQLVYKSALQYSNYSFILIGKSSIDLGKLEQLENVYILGTRPYDSICNYLYNSDIGIIPFKRSSLVDAINPLKLYEYLACGLRVVSIKWDEIRTFDAYCNLAESDEEFIGMLGINEGKNIKQAQQLLRDSDWVDKLKSILE